MKRLMAIAGFVGGLLLPVAGQTSVDPAFGYWLSENKRAIVEIGPCGDQACGHMVWLKNPVGDDGTPKRDAKGNLLCGLQLVRDFRREDAGVWEDGHIYNPRDGKVYSALMRVRTESELEVRGYAGLPILGRSQVWTRALDDRGGCPAQPEG